MLGIKSPIQMKIGVKSPFEVGLMKNIISNFNRLRVAVLAGLLHIRGM